MKRQNIIGDSIDATEHKSSYDHNAKWLIAHEPILARILQETVAEFKGMNAEEIIHCIRATSISEVSTIPGITRKQTLSQENYIPNEEGGVYMKQVR